MGASNDTLREAFIRAAVAEASELGVNPIDLLMQIVRGKYRAEGSSGRILVSTSEAGGSATFQVSPGFGPADVMGVAIQAIQWLERQPNPANPDFSSLRQTRRLRFAFNACPPL